MELTTTSILTLVIGLIIGGAIVFVIYYIINKKVRLWLILVNLTYTLREELIKI